MIVVFGFWEWFGVLVWLVVVVVWDDLDLEDLGGFGF